MARHKRRWILAVLLAAVVVTFPVRFEWWAGELRCHSWVPLAERIFAVTDHGSAVDYINYAKSCEPPR